MPDQWPDVPDAGDDAIPDPNLDRLRGPRLLPAFYQPAAMATQVDGWRRGAVWLLIALFLATTAAGVCLTYGPELGL